MTKKEAHERAVETVYVYGTWPSILAECEAADIPITTKNGKYRSRSVLEIALIDPKR